MTTTTTPLIPATATLLELDPARLHPSPENRDVGDCAGLTASVKEIGVLQPILVTHDPDLPDGDWRIVAGERRWTAATNAGKQIPAINIDELSPVTRAELRLVENLHRKDLEPLELAEAFAELRAFGRTQRDIAATASYGQPQVSKLLSLLELPDPAKDALREQRITQRTALAIVGLVKDTPRLSRVLRALEGDSTPAEYDRIVQAEVGDATRDKERAARIKALDDRAAELEADGLERLTVDGDPFADGWLERDDDEELPATAFTVDVSYDRVPIGITLWRRPTGEEAAEIAKAEAEQTERLVRVQRRAPRDWEQEQLDRAARVPFMTDLVTQKTPLAKDADPGGFIVHGLIDHYADIEDYELLEETLRLLARHDPPEGDDVDDLWIPTALHEYVDESDEHRDFGLLALVLANLNAAWGSRNDQPSTMRLLAFLEANGFTPPAVEGVSGEEVAEAGASPADAEGSVVPSVDSEPEMVAGADAASDTTDVGDQAVAAAGQRPAQPSSSEESLASDTAAETGTTAMGAPSSASKTAPVSAPSDLPQRDPAAEPTGINATDPKRIERALAGHEPWAGYDEATVPDILNELDMTSTTADLTDRVRRYELANGGRAAIVSHCVYLLATSDGALAPGAMCQVCELRVATSGSTASGTAECAKCDEIEARRTELRREFATDPGPKRAAELQTEMDGLFVDQYEVQPGDTVHEDGSITRDVDVAHAAS